MKATSSPVVVIAPDPVIAIAPIGPVIDTVIGPWGLGTATFDATRKYRYRLSRVWNDEGERINFIMLNPSTADAFILDPTVRRCVGYVKLWGAGSLEVTNIFALRSTDPKALKTCDDPVGADNNYAIVAAALSADRVVVGWGTHGAYKDRQGEVAELLSNAGVKVSALIITKNGHPGHPLYVKGDAQLVAWPTR
jgi:hypothetical protein